MDNRNLSETLPYGKLAMLGIDREKADLLPQEVKEKLLSGEVTPLMQVSIRTQSGNAVTLPLKLQMAYLYVILASFPQLFYPLMTRQFFCDFHEKSEDFCVS